MIRLRFFALSILVMVFSPPAQAIMTYSAPEIDAKVSMVGSGGIVGDCKVTDTKGVTMANGWKTIEAKLDCVVLKGNGKYAASDDSQTVTMRTMSNQVIKGLNVPYKGQEGIMFILEPSKAFGLSSFLFNGSANIEFDEENDEKVVPAKTFTFKNPDLRNQIQTMNPKVKAAFQAQSTAPTVKAGGVKAGVATTQYMPRQDARAVIKTLALKIYPSQK